MIGAADASSGSEESSEKEPSSGSCMPQGPHASSVSVRQNYVEVNVSSFMKFEVFMRPREVPSETRTSLISLSGSIVVHSFPTLRRPGDFDTN